MSRDVLLEQNQSTGETERIIKREQEADLLKTPEQQAAQGETRAAIPKKKILTKERTFDEASGNSPHGKAKVRLHFEEIDKPPGGKLKHSPLSRPAQEAGLFVHNKIHSVEKGNSGVEGAHKSEEATERLEKYVVRKVKQGYRSHKLKPYRAAAKAEKNAVKANVNFRYHKALHQNL